MKVILYMAITANGLIAKENDDTSWVSETEWANFSQVIKTAGNMVVGRRTYEIMLQQDEFTRSGLAKIKTIVVSDRPVKVYNSQLVSIAKSPPEALNILQKQGFKTILICGGGGLNVSFMKAGLIDELYLDIEPIIFGRGIRLFAEADFENKLELLGVKKISAQEVQLHYKVKR